MKRSVVNTPVLLELKKIYCNKLTGTLSIEGKSFKKIIYFENGELVFAKSNVIQERLGEILFKSGKLSKTQFWNIHKLMEGKKEKVGKVLVSKDILSKKDLFIGIQIQITIITKSIFYLNTGTWTFEEGDIPVPEDSKFHLNVAEIVFNGIEIFKNVYYFKNIYTNHKVVSLDPSKDLIEILPKNAKNLFDRIKNSENITCNDLCSNGEDEDTCWKYLTALFITGVVNFKITVQKRKNEDNIESIINLYEKLKMGSEDYYSFFDLKIDASIEEIKKQYFMFARKFHPDRIGESPDPGIREKANFVFAEINRAYEILDDPKKRDEYNIKKFKKGANKNVLQKNLREKASILYSKARTLYNRKQYWEATALMEEAIKSVKDKGIYYLFLGLSQMNIESMKWTAEKNLAKAASLDPLSAEPLIALGKLFESEKMENRAKAFFQKAVSIDPENKTAVKNLKKLKDSDKKGLKKKLFSKH